MPVIEFAFSARWGRLYTLGLDIDTSTGKPVPNDEGSIYLEKFIRPDRTNLKFCSGERDGLYQFGYWIEQEHKNLSIGSLLFAGGTDPRGDSIPGVKIKFPPGQTLTDPAPAIELLAHITKKIDTKIVSNDEKYEAELSYENFLEFIQDNLTLLEKVGSCLTDAEPANRMAKDVEPDWWAERYKTVFVLPPENGQKTAKEKNAKVRQNLVTATTDVLNKFLSGIISEKAVVVMSPDQLRHLESRFPIQHDLQLPPAQAEQPALSAQTPVLPVAKPVALPDAPPKFTSPLATANGNVDPVPVRDSFSIAAKQVTTPIVQFVELGLRQLEELANSDGPYREQAQKEIVALAKQINEVAANIKLTR